MINSDLLGVANLKFNFPDGLKRAFASNNHTVIKIALRKNSDSAVPISLIIDASGAVAEAVLQQ